MIYCTSPAIKGIFLTRKTYGGKLSQDSEVRRLQPVCCKKQQKKVPDQLLASEDSEL